MEEEHKGKEQSPAEGTSQVERVKDEIRAYVDAIELQDSVQCPEGDGLSNPSDLLFSTVEFVTATKEHTLHVFTQRSPAHPASE